MSAAAHLAAALLAAIGLRPPLMGAATKGVRGLEEAFRAAAEKGSAHNTLGRYLQANHQQSLTEQLYTSKPGCNTTRQVIA